MSKRDTTQKFRTARAAFREAGRRWGKKAYIQEDRSVPVDGEDVINEKTGKCMYRRHRCSVGRLNGVGGYTFFSVEGSGGSWDAAFSEVDRKAEADRQRYAALRAEAERKQSAKRR